MGGANPSKIGGHANFARADRQGLPVEFERNHSVTTNLPRLFAGSTIRLRITSRFDNGGVYFSIQTWD
jgi:hypothetical protein